MCVIYAHTQYLQIADDAQCAKLEVKLEVKVRCFMQFFHACMQFRESRSILPLNAPTKPVCATDLGMLRRWPLAVDDETASTSCTSERQSWGVSSKIYLKTEIVMDDASVTSLPTAETCLISQKCSYYSHRESLIE